MGDVCGLFFAAALANPKPPEVVAKCILDIVDGDSWQLRYLVGADATEFVEGRKRKSDEQVIAEAAQGDEEFRARIKSQLGLDIQL